MNKNSQNSRKLQNIMKFRQIGITLVMTYLSISTFIISATSVSDSSKINDIAKVQKSIEIPNALDTIKTEFLNDTIIVNPPIPIGQVIYTEHKTDLNTLLDYAFPIIMLILGVMIDRIILICTENKRVKREGTRWKCEIKSLSNPLKQQQEAFKKFIKEYCDIKDGFDIPHINSQVLLKCEIFDSLNKEDLYKFLQLQHKNEDVATHEYHKVIQVISSLKSCQHNLSDVISEMKSRSNKLINQFEEVTREYNRRLADCLNDNQLPLAGTMLQNLYNEKINKQMPYVNIFELEDSFVQPSINIIVESNRDQKVRNELRNNLQSMLDTIQGLRNEKIYLKQNLEQLIEIYGKAADTIVSIKFDK